MINILEWLWKYNDGKDKTGNYHIYRKQNKNQVFYEKEIII